LSRDDSVSDTDRSDFALVCGSRGRPPILEVAEGTWPYYARRTVDAKGESMRRVALTVNGARHDVELEPRELLAYVLRDRLGLTGTNVGCDTSSCGSCTVLVNGESVKSCTMLGVQADGTEITTIEGLARNGELHPVQQAFHEHHALQCGYCTPGMVLAAVSLIDSGAATDEAAIREGLEGNLCRCTGYHNIVQAVAAAAGVAS